MTQLWSIIFYATQNNTWIIWNIQEQFFSKMRITRIIGIVLKTKIPHFL